MLKKVKAFFTFVNQKAIWWLIFLNLPYSLQNMHGHYQNINISQENKGTSNITFHAGGRIIME